ncbi:MAG: YggU family protein [Desulfobacca sp.]|nr:YggU family protein [Desulfobacca sp.]
MKPIPEGVLLTLWVQPGARKTTWSGWHGPQLKLSVQSPPVEGAANQGCITFLAQWFGIKRSQVILLKGEKSRSKVFLIKGVVLEKCLPLIPSRNQDLLE